MGLCSIVTSNDRITINFILYDRRDRPQSILYGSSLAHREHSLHEEYRQFLESFFRVSKLASTIT